MGLREVVQQDHLVNFANTCLQFTEKYYLTIRPVALAGYGSIAHEAKPNGLLTRGP